MTELEVAVANVLGISLEDCRTESLRSVCAKIPVAQLDTLGTISDKNNAGSCVQGTKIKIFVTALRFYDIFAAPIFNVDNVKALPSFSATFFDIVKSCKNEQFRSVAVQNPNCYYRRVQKNLDDTRKCMEHIGCCIRFFQELFRMDNSSPEDSKSGLPVSNIFSNLRLPHKILSNDDTVYLVYLEPEFTIRDCLMYSPCLYTNDNIKTSFVLFQLLQFFSSIENDFSGDLSSLCWNDVEVDSRGWIKVQLPENCFVIDKTTENSATTRSKCTDGKFDALPDVLDGWICGEVSNFDYLMFLNKLAGRDPDDPNHHPILPWVSTLRKRYSWRDLTKSKYRLNKGDRQLNIQYSMMSEGMDMRNTLSQRDLHQVPHHVPEYLSDITYYVYTARRTPKSTLCKLVRSYWEPNEYPSSIQRMQEWTPDECIPEFYTDPKVFESIHEDMCDLCVPDWCEDPEDFIVKHREMLESETVSQKLHHWIDITFGYKLSGEYARSEKNVCLSLVDNHTGMRTRGISQLFTMPHPRRRIESANVMIDDIDDASDVIDHDKMTQLPKDLNLTSELDDLEILLRFKAGVWNDTRFSESLSSATKISWTNLLNESSCKRKLSDRNMAAFVCLMVELFLPLETRTLSHGFDISRRLRFCINIFYLHKTNFPSPFRFSMQYLIDNINFLQIDPNFDANTTESFNFQGHPTPAVGLLSSPCIHLLPFADYFHDLYDILEIIMLQTGSFSKALPMDHLSSITEKLLNMLEDIDNANDCLVILTPYVCALLRQDRYCATAFLLANFEVISRSMGQKCTNTELLPIILHLYEQTLEDSTDDNFPVALYDRCFLLQLSTRLGLQSFILNIPPCLANALIHKSREDVSDVSKNSLFWLMNRMGPTLTSKYVVKHLFRVLSLCFVSIDGMKSAGYSRVRDCLLYAAKIFGPSFITLQYFPFLTHRISSSVNHVTLATRHQAAIESSLVAVSHLITYLSDAVLMEELSRISNDILIPATNLVGSQKICFPGGAEARKSMCIQVLHLMALVVVRIGREMSRKHMTHLFRTFFSHFNQGDSISAFLSSSKSSSDPSFSSIDSDSVVIHQDPSTKTYQTFESTRKIPRRLHKSWITESPDSSPSRGSPFYQEDCAGAKEELVSTFCAETAYRSFVSFTRLLGGIHMEKVLGNHHDYIHKLSLQYQNSLGDKAMVPEEQLTGHYHTDVTMVGNQLVVDQPLPQFDIESKGNIDFDIIETLLASSGGIQTEDQLGECARRALNTVPASQLTENWLAYWEHEIGLPDDDKDIHFNQIELQSFSGHANAVRCISCHLAEDWFLSGGKDKVVKIWSVPENLDLREAKDSRHAIMNDRYTYKLHRKGVNYVGILESEQLIISNDGNIHVWDPYSGQQILAFDNTDVKSGFALVSTLPSPFRYALTVTNESDLRVVDTRRKCLAHEYKIVVGTSMGIARAMCVLENGNRVVVGFSTGSISAIDLRMGNKLTIKPAHEADISAMTTVSDKKYLTASSDQTICLWENGQGNAVSVCKGIQEPVHTFQIFNDEVISGSFANRIYVHDMRSKSEGGNGTDRPMALSKLRNDTFRGVLTTFCVLPMKRQLLLASDTGNIKLMA